MSFIESQTSQFNLFVSRSNADIKNIAVYFAALGMGGLEHNDQLIL